MNEQKYVKEVNICYLNDSKHLLSTEDSLQLLTFFFFI